MPVAGIHCGKLNCLQLKQVTIPGEGPLAKKKEQKKKERERRVAQKKHAEAQKRNQEKNAEAASKAGRKADLFTAPVSIPKTNQVAASVPKPFNYRRSGG